MPARPESKVVEIAEELVRLLKKIDSTLDAGNWLTSPRVIGWGFSVPDALDAKDSVFLRVRGIVEDDQQADQQHEATLDCEVLCLAFGGEQAQRQAWRMQADVFALLGQNEYLPQPDGTKLLRDMNTFTATVEVEGFERAGLAAVSIPFRARFAWTHAAP